MSKILQVRETAGKSSLTYAFRSMREVDDIILQLLNESELDGFLQSRIEKKEKLVCYEIDGLTSLQNLPARVLPRRQFIGILQDLCSMLIYLEDSFIGLEYIAFDGEEIYVDPESLKLHLAVLPIQNPAFSGSALQNCVLDLIGKFTPAEADPFSADAIMRVTQGMSRITDLQNLIRHLQETASATEEVVTEETGTEASVSDQFALGDLQESDNIPDNTLIFDKDLKKELSEVLSQDEDAISENPFSIPLDLVQEEPAAEEPVTAQAKSPVPEQETEAEAGSLPEQEETAGGEGNPAPETEPAPEQDEAAVGETQHKEEPADTVESLPEEEPATEKSSVEPAPIPEPAVETIDETAAREVQPSAEKADQEQIQEPMIEASPQSLEQGAEASPQSLEQEAEASGQAPEPAAEAAEEPVEEKEIEVSEGESVKGPAIEPEERSQEEKAEITDEIPVAAIEETIAQAEQETRRPAYLFRKKTSELIPLSSSCFLIGKIPHACDYIIYENPAVSRIHAVIRYVEEENIYVIIDCDSTNHTYVNGKKIPGEEAMPLFDKDRIHLATEEFVFNQQD